MPRNINISVKEYYKFKDLATEIGKKNVANENYHQVRKSGNVGHDKKKGIDKRIDKIYGSPGQNYPRQNYVAETLSKE